MGDAGGFGPLRIFPQPCPASWSSGRQALPVTVPLSLRGTQTSPHNSAASGTVPGPASRRRPAAVSKRRTPRTEDSPEAPLRQIVALPLCHLKGSFSVSSAGGFRGAASDSLDGSPSGFSMQTGRASLSKTAAAFGAVRSCCRAFFPLLRARTQQKKTSVQAFRPSRMFVFHITPARLDGFPTARTGAENPLFGYRTAYCRPA